MKRDLNKNFMSKTKTEEREAHICKYHLLGVQNSAHVHALDIIPLVPLVRPVADLASKKATLDVRDTNFQHREKEIPATYPYMAMRAR
jgi:hypothetical protein